MSFSSIFTLAGTTLIAAFALATSVSRYHDKQIWNNAREENLSQMYATGDVRRNLEIYKQEIRRVLPDFYGADCGKINPDLMQGDGSLLSQMCETIRQKTQHQFIFKQ